MAHSLPSCIINMRVLKDICRRVPAWGVLDTWVSSSGERSLCGCDDDMWMCVVVDFAAASTEVYSQC